MSRVGARIILLILLLVTCVPIAVYIAGVGDGKSIGSPPQANELTVPEEDPLVSEDEAMQTIFDMLPGADYDDVLEISQTYAEGGWIYRGRIKGKKVVYEYQVDGENGNILRWIVVKK